MEWPSDADLDLPDREPWDRLQGETSKAYSAFRAYRDTTPIQRSVKTAADQAGLSERHCQRLITEFCWVERAEAWDDACHRIEDRERLEAIRAMHKVHRGAGRLAVSKAIQALNRLQSEDLNPAQIVRLMALGAKLERDTLLTSVEELQGIEIEDDDEEDPWERIARELDPHGED